MELFIQPDAVSREKILIVDDDESIGRLCETYLAQNGYRPIYIQSPREALDRVEREAFDLLVADLAMPEMDGLQLIRTARSIRAEIPAIVMTAYGFLDRVIQSLDADVRGFILKPFSEEEFLHEVEDVLEQCRLTKENLRLKALMPLYEVSETLILGTDMTVLLNSVVGVAASETHSDQVVLMLQGVGTDPLSVKAACPPLPSDTQAHVAFSDAVLQMGQVTLSGREALIYRDRSEIQAHHPRMSHPMCNGDTVASLISIPLIYMERCLGVLGLFRKGEDHPYNQGDLDLAQILAGQIAVAVENATLFSDLSSSQFETMKVLAQLIEAKDHYTRGHCDRLVTYVLALARRMGLTDEEKRLLSYGAALHDIGKIGVHGLILNKPDKLTKEEREEIKTHPALGAEIVKGIEFLCPVIPMIYYHQEFYNGLGYPEGLAGEQIPLYARMVAIADTFDAMTSDRPYRKALPFDVALAELRRCAGTQLDPVLVGHFVAAIQEDFSQTHSHAT
jgi:response regulator RpfG family c-di-GMP phosphodiesterase